MKNMKKPIGILGGSFDPVHLGHIKLAQLVLKATQLKEIRFVPCYQHAIKETVTAPAKDRLAMLALATENEPTLITDDREIKRQHKSYMIDTLVSLQKDFSDTPICLIMGEDAFYNLPAWHEWQKIIECCHIIVINRPDTNPVLPNEALNLLTSRKTDRIEDLHDNLAGKIYQLKIEPIEISSTMIREELKENEACEQLLDKQVLDYIKNHQLY